MTPEFIKVKEEEEKKVEEEISNVSFKEIMFEHICRAFVSPITVMIRMQ